jgi:ribosomal protein L7/L12
MDELDDVHRRIRILEGQVAFLARAANVNLPDEAALATSTVPAEVVELVRAGNAMGAIQRYRELTGCSLGEAKQVVDGLTA